MKVAIIGTGAMGCVYAGLMCEAGHEVWAVDLWRDHLDAIAEHGLHLSGASGDRIIKGIHTSENPADVGVCDLYVIATKAAGVGPAASAIAPLMTADSLVITIQNGLGAAERIAQHMLTTNVLLGVADGFGASITDPGHAHHSSMKLIRIGEMGGGMTPRLQTLTKLWCNAGFNAKAFADINQLIWEKYLCNTTLSAACTVFDCTLGELINNPSHWKIALGCTLEAYALGQARGINFSFDDPIKYVTEFTLKMPDARPSMLLDHQAKRPSEIDAINGMAVELGEKLGIETPYNETLTAIVRLRESKFQTLVRDVD